MKREDLLKVANLPVGDVPFNTLAPLLQVLGGLGVTIRDLQGFLSRKDAQERLARSFFSRGYDLNAREVQALEILGHDDVLLAPVVLDQLGFTVPGIDFNRDIPLAWFSNGILDKCAEENNRGYGNWRLIYLAKLPLLDLPPRFNQEVHMTMYRSGCAAEEVSMFPEHQDWVTQEVTPGYRLINFLPTYDVLSTKDGWDELQGYISAKGKPLSAAEYVQALLLCGGIQGALPVEDSILAHWAIETDEFRVFIDTQRIDNPISHQVKIHIQQRPNGRRRKTDRMRSVYSIS